MWHLPDLENQQPREKSCDNANACNLEFTKTIYKQQIGQIF